MQKRTFLKTSLWLAAGAALSPLLKACDPAKKANGNKTAVIPPPKLRRTGPFTLPPLPYPSDALEPYIDRQTMEIHHGKHHGGYVNNLNDAVVGTVYADYELDDILARITAADADRKIRNNAGGHWNHTFFWQIMKPGGAPLPEGQFATALNAAFGSFDKFKTAFSDTAKSVFGSGWAWLCVGKDKSLFISTTPNQDNPLMMQIVSKTGTPIFGLDVWEHAYYLKYQNRRPDYISAFFNVVNWEEVANRYNRAMFG
ncbi:MAG: superoxide dismutase [Saprospiraceae bacterium]|nr:superoxide dismutase [Saprospiraceae bacterium]MDW8229981.1 superoxide dismutase [Saprospiraceae bacterium]